MSTNEAHEPTFVDDDKTSAEEDVEVQTPPRAKQRSTVTFDDNQKVNDIPQQDYSPEKPAAAAAPPPPAGMPEPIPPEFITFTKDVEGDSVGVKAFLEAFTNPMSYNAMRAAFRTVAFVSFPLLTIAIHPNTMFKLKFPAMLIAAVISSSTHRPSLGEQIGFHSWIWRSLIYCLVIGTVVNTWNLHKHIPAWYGIIAASIFCASLCSNGSIRRFMYLHVFVYLMQLRMYHTYFGRIPHNNAAFFVADHMIGSLLGQAALLFPYPVLVKKMVDMIMDKLFSGVAKMLMGMIMFLWSPDPHASSYFYNDKSPFDKIETVLSVMPALLWFSNWEPTEFLLRNNIRRLKLSLLRRIMALTYAAFSAGQSVVSSRREQADRVALQRIRMELFRQAHPKKSIADKQSNEDDDDPLGGTTKHREEENEEAKRKEEAAALRKNSADYAKAFAMSLFQTVGEIGKVDSKPKELLEKVSFDALDEKSRLMRRNLRMEQIQVFLKQKESIERKKEENARKRGEDSKSHSTAPQTANTHAPYGRHPSDAPLSSTVTSQDDMEAEEAEAIQQHQSVIDDAEVFIILSELFFHVIMSMIAGEIQTFKETMEDYKPSAGICSRVAHFFIIDPWVTFFRDAWYQISFCYPHNFRVIKDAIKMTCAYLSACAMNFEIWIPQGGLYFFGTTILIGLPQDEESLSMAVNRLAGNTLACAVGYLAYHNTKNLSEMLGCILPFQFFFFIFRNHAVFGQTFFYAAVISTAGMATATQTLELLVRVLASAYTVFAYYLCLSLVFPYSPVKILWNNRCKLSKAISETIDDAVATVEMNIEHDPNYDPNATDHNAYFHTDAIEMCSHLNLEVKLIDSIMHACEKWSPFAAGESVIRGIDKYPAGASHSLLCSEQRTVASVKLLVFGVQLLHRPRSVAPEPTLERLMNTSVSKFLHEFAGAVRLVEQDIIHSIQQSRKWSYPNHLRNVSYLSRMRPKLFSILFEIYVLLGNDLSHGTEQLKDDDYKDLHQSFAAISGREDQLEVRCDDEDEGKSKHSQSHLESSGAFDHNRSFADRMLAKRYEDAAGTPPPLSGNPSFALGGTYRHNAKLEEADATPADMYPITQETPEIDISVGLRKQQEEEEERSSLAASKNQSFVSMRPTKSKSKLIQESRGFSYVPLYAGPQFSYREDELGLPIDTDFTALVSILASCNSIICEIESSTGYNNTISSYNKQMHETTLILKLIDKASEKLSATHMKHRNKYHPLPPNSGGRTKLVTQPDTWGDWRF
ncbi:hypothetical protein, conserved [Angomonas deanei]|uniref:Fusaric acid resistance protein-like n=1 Tax=Angomonas deanei TaxID=59799 RepID=A0A7G2C750_9TRYP|nr:hypothetical protein, conserved [Angomonas deanei]